MNNENKCQDFILESFKNYLDKTIKDSDEISKIINKGKEIIEFLDSKPDKNDKKGLLVGHVQSGKTVNFISVITQAFYLSYKIVIILTSIDNKLHNQTVERLQEALDRKSNSNFLKFIELNQLKNIEQMRYEILSEINSNHFVIIPILKKNYINNVNNILNFYSFQNQKILVIDDEGDLASASHTIKRDSKTYEKIESLLKNTNSTYLTVTATPLVNLLMDKDKSLYPKWVFCIEPGKGYVGIEKFTNNNNKYFKIICQSLDDGIDWYKTDEFKKALNYYFLVVTKNLQNSCFNEKTHTNMLIHTDIEIHEHFDFSDDVKHYKKNLESKLNKNIGNIEYDDYLKYLNNICNEFMIDFEINDENINLFKRVLFDARVYTINGESTEKNNLNDNQCSILIGSKMLERGITLDNLLVTFFTNRAKYKSAIDTLLQRARWYGYRTKILDDMKIFTTQRIVNDFNNINIAIKSMWDDLLTAEKNKIPLDEFAYSMFLVSKDLIPTSKAPLVILKILDKLYCPFVRILKDKKSLFIDLVNALLNSDDYIEFSEKYKYKKIEFTESLLRNEYNIIEILKIFISNELLNKLIEIIKNKRKNVKLVFLDNLEDANQRNQPRIRSCYSDNNWKIKQIFQGSNGIIGKSNYYPGDTWNKDEKFKNDVFIQIHKIKPICKDDEKNIDNPINKIDFVYVPVMQLPDDINISRFVSKKQN